MSASDRSTRPYLLQADGASRGNPGPAAYGFLLLDPAGRTVAEGGAPVGHATNNVAEYRGLLAGLESARSLGVRRLEVRLDSELVVRQMNGVYRVKSAALQTMHARARELTSGFESVTYRHVPRAENQRADELANRALDGGEGGKAGSQTGDRDRPAGGRGKSELHGQGAG